PRAENPDRPDRAGPLAPPQRVLPAAAQTVRPGAVPGVLPEAVQAEPPGAAPGVAPGAVRGTVAGRQGVREAFPAAVPGADIPDRSAVPVAAAAGPTGETDQMGQGRTWDLRTRGFSTFVPGAFDLPWNFLVSCYTGSWPKSDRARRAAPSPVISVAMPQRAPETSTPR